MDREEIEKRILKALDLLEQGKLDPKAAASYSLLVSQAIELLNSTLGEAINNDKPVPDWLVSK